MALQASELVMVALGVQADVPPIDLQPKLSDAIHLRWAFPRERGFPWYGYYLFRRPHEFRGERCLARALPGSEFATALGSSFVCPPGVLSSDSPLLLTDDFLPSGTPEVDLAGHTFVRLELPPDEPAFRVRVRIGFREIPAERTECVDFRKLAPDIHPNPLDVEGVAIDAKGPLGESLPRLRLLAHEVNGRAGVALDVAGAVEVTLPVISRAVQLDLTAGARMPVVEALDKIGKVIATVTPALDPRQPKTVELRTAGGFRRLRVRAPEGLVLIHRLCWLVPAASRAPIPITAYDGPMVVATTTVTGQAGQVATAALTFDRITAVQIGGSSAAALVELCAQIIPDVALKDWQPVPNCPQPLLLPLTHPDYPPQPAQENLPAAQAVALSRVVYGHPGDWVGANFASLHARLAALVKGGPSSRAMAARERAEQNVAGTPNPPAPGIETPSIPSLHPLDLVLLGALHPAVAQMVGLYWADQKVNAASSFDYLIVADHQNVAGGIATNLLSHVRLQGWADVDAWITFDRRMAPTPPLGAPAGVRAYALPGGTYRARGGANAGVQDADGNVGLTWPTPTDGQGYLRPGQPVFYHVWRDVQGNGATPVPSPQATELVTARGPLLVSRPAAVPTEPPQYPGDWPPFPLPALDFGMREGWYGYQVNSIDLFGRFSPRSAFAEWRQWVPAPEPRPWYYINPPTDRVIHPSSVRIVDRTPPPPPAFVEAWVLDPGDTIIVRDAALNAWRQTLPVAQRERLVGLRVRWRWNVSQQRQAPDTREFRIYWHPGTNPPANWERVAAWQIRCHVTPFASNVTLSANGDRTYQVFLPVSAGQGPFGAGVPLNPTRADPVAYASVTVTAVDDAAQATDTWPGTGALASRTGNESRTASPSRVFRVLREPPPPPVPVVDSGRVYATPADWHSRSFYTFRWRPLPDLFTHVFRALDESVFAADWELRPRAALQPTDDARFPDPATEPTWTAAKRQQVCGLLNALNAFANPKTPASKEQALRAYRALSDDALRVLANLPGCEKAFVQLTIKGLKSTDAETQDRRGPDDPAGYVVRPALRAYLDTLDGRATNRYLYRAGYVDAAQNRSGLGAAGTPVRLPNVVPPRAPAITKVTAGDRRITLAWASNREPDLLEYRVFRAETKDDAADLRRMVQVAVVAADPNPAMRPAAGQWSDNPVPGLKYFWYRVVAVDRPDSLDPRVGGGNLSEPSPAARGRALQPVPAPAVVHTAAWNAAHTAVRVDWQLTDSMLMPRLERRAEEGRPWIVVAGSLGPGTEAATDTPPDPARTYEYRVRVRDHVGQQAVSQSVTTP